MPVADPGWTREFDDPIPLPDGGQLVTLRDAAGYVLKLPAADQESKEWRTAIEILIGTAEGRDFLMHARIGVMKALYRDLPPLARRHKRTKAYRITR